MDPPEDTIGLLNNTLNGLSKWVILMEADGTIIRSNRAFTGCTGGLTPPNSLKEIFPEIAGELITDLHELTISGESQTRFRRTVRLVDGRSTVIRFNASPRKAAAGGNTGLIIYCQEITDHIEMEQFEQDAYRQIERDIEQCAILVCHLRNLLTVIIGLCEMFEDQKVASKTHTRAQEINDIITWIDRGWIE